MRFRRCAVVIAAAVAAAQPLCAQDAISVSKNFAPGGSTAGRDVAFQVHVFQQDGVTAANNVQLTDNIPAQTTFVSAVQNSGPAFACTTPAIGASTGTITCTAANIPAGSPEALFTFTFHLPPIASGNVSNTATVTTTSPNNTANDSFTVLTGIVTEADLSVTKTGPTTVMAGTNVTWSITVSNAGPSYSQNVTLTDSPASSYTFVSLTQTSGPAFSCTTPAVGFPGGISCQTSTLPNGSSATFQLVEKYSSNDGDPTNTANATATTADPGPGLNGAFYSPPIAFDADLQSTKSGSLTATAGQTVTYTITAINNGPSDAAFPGFPILTDALPSNLTFESWTQTGGPTWFCSTPAVGSSGTITCQPATPAPGTAGTFRLVARVASNVANGATVSNTATYSSATPDSVPSNNSSTATATVSTLADLSVTKIAGAATVDPGNNITYTVTVSNSGPSNAASVALTDVVPTGTTFVSQTQNSGPAFGCTAPAVGATGTINCTIASLAAGASATFTFVVKNNATNLGGTNISNTAQVSTATTESSLTNNSSTTNVTVTAAGLAITKSDSPDPVQAGTDITYTITVTNVGTIGAHNVSLTDAVPANTTFVSLAQTSGPGFACTTPAVGATGTVTCTNVLVAAGAAATFQLVVRVNPATATGTVISNTANVSTSDTDPNLSNNTATTTTTVAITGDVRVTKSGPASVTPGGNITYTVTISNIGTSDAQNVTLNDAVPSGTTFVSETQSSGPGFACSTPLVGGTGTISCNIATLAASAGATFSIVVNAVGAPGSTITNTATGSSTSADANGANNTASSSTVIAGPDLAVTKSDSPDPVAPGADITYTVTVSNNGTGGANNVSLTDVVPTNTTFVSLMQTAGPSFACSAPAAGATGTITCTNALLAPATSATFQIVVRVAPATPGGSTITNTANATTTDSEATTANNNATATTTVSAVALADLGVTKSDTPDPVTAGGTITYSITVTNAGTAAAANVSLSDVVPTNTTFASFTAPVGWTPSTPAAGAGGTVTATNASLAAGASASFTLVVNVNGGVASGTLITNTANVTTPSAETSIANNSATATTTVAAPTPTADVSISKTAGGSAVQPGGQITYTITVQNNGPSTANGVTITDPLPAGTTFVSATPSQGSCSGTATVACTIGSLSNGSSAIVTLIVTAPSTPGTVVNSAGVSSTTPDPAAGNNTATVSVAVMANVPTLNPLMLALLAGVLATVGFFARRA